MKKRLLKNAMLRKRIWLRKMFLRMNYLFCLLVLGAHFLFLQKSILRMD